MTRPGRRGFLASVAFFAAVPPLRATAGMGMRVAALDWALMETMLAIGCTPVAGVAVSDWNRSDMGPHLPPSVADLGLSPEIDFELLATLEPDLIVMSPFVEQLQPALERIAPVWNVSVFERAASPLGHQRELTRKIGRRLGRTVEADRYLEAAERTLDQRRARALARPRRPVLLVNFVDARHVRVYAGNGLYQNVLDRIGLANAWTGQTNYWGYATVGIERLATTAELDLIAFQPIPADALPTLESSPLWTELPFVKAGHVSILPGVLMFGALPSALRLSRLLDEHLTRPASPAGLRAALAGRSRCLPPENAVP
jgi:iron complex transport system substrate-binding protein